MPGGHHVSGRMLTYAHVCSLMPGGHHLRAAEVTATYEEMRELLDVPSADVC